MQLTVDIGNTAIKAILWQGDEAVDTLAGPRLDGEAVARFAANRGVDRAMVCGVRPLPAGFEEALGHVAPLVRFTALTPTPLVNCYGNPAALGSDRLAAAVGAAALAPGREILVADLGTAATLDRVSADGRFLGGNISAGLRMRLNALHHHTALLPLPEVPEAYPAATPAFATDTAAAMLNGAILGLAAEIAAARGRLDNPAEAAVILTGGDARLIAPLLDFETTTDPHLVGRGLNRILTLQ